MIRRQFMLGGKWLVDEMSSIIEEILLPILPSFASFGVEVAKSKRKVNKCKMKKQTKNKQKTKANEFKYYTFFLFLFCFFFPFAFVEFLFFMSVHLYYFCSFLHFRHSQSFSL